MRKQEKEKLVVVALGQLYLENKEIIEEHFHVVALADNNGLKLQNRNDGFKYIKVDQVGEETFDKVLVCTESQYSSLRVQLLEQGIRPEKICSLQLLEHIRWEKDYGKYVADREMYRQLHQSLGMDKFGFREDNQCIMLSDYRKPAGKADDHYFYQDILTASKIIGKRPACHVDVGSRIDGFISHLLAAGIRTTVIDIRPLPVWNMGVGIPELEFVQADATDLNGIGDNSIASLSSLHAVEHFGLGRYGDEVNPLACFAAMRSLQRVLAEEGTLYLSVPVGREEMLMFNGHRIFSPVTVVQIMDEIRLLELYVIHAGKILAYSGEDVEKGKYAGDLGGYDCGIFIFTKDRTEKPE